MRVVLDTNVLISAIFFAGIPARILLAGGARCIASGDRALLRASGFEGIEVLTPRAFTRRYL